MTRGREDNENDCRDTNESEEVMKREVEGKMEE